MLTQTTIEINGVKYPGDAAHTLLSNELSSAKAENVKLKEELAACKMDSYIQGRKDMQDEIIDKLGSYEANKCAQIAASIDATRKEQPLEELSKLSEGLGGY